MSLLQPEITDLTTIFSRDICKPKALCKHCPVRNYCQYYLQQMTPMIANY